MNTMKNNLSNYKSYQAVDFFNDHLFVASVKAGTIDSDLLWKEVADRYPDTKPQMEEAAQWIALLANQPVYPSKNKANTWNNILQQLPRLEQQVGRARMVRLYIKRVAQAAAIVVFGLLAYDVSQQGDKIRATTYAKQDHFALPDESEINLNSNSSIRYVRNWKTDKPREVWLRGEALFHVKHLAVKNRINESDYFKVHAGGLVLTVTGTRFNVKDRRGVVNVALLEGSLRVEDEKTRELLATLHPGESFVYELNKQSRLYETVKAKATTAWTNGEIELDKRPLSTLVQEIEDNFGYKVQVEDSSLLNRHLSGTIPAKDIEDILFVMRQTLHVQTIVNGKQLIIK